MSFLRVADVIFLPQGAKKLLLDPPWIFAYCVDFNLQAFTIWPTLSHLTHFEYRYRHILLSRACLQKRFFAFFFVALYRIFLRLVKNAPSSPLTKEVVKHIRRASSKVFSCIFTRCGYISVLFKQPKKASANWFSRSWPKSHLDAFCLSSVWNSSTVCCGFRIIFRNFVFLSKWSM